MKWNHYKMVWVRITWTPKKGAATTLLTKWLLTACYIGLFRCWLNVFLFSRGRRLFNFSTLNVFFRNFYCNVSGLISRQEDRIKDEKMNLHFPVSHSHSLSFIVTLSKHPSQLRMVHEHIFLCFFENMKKELKLKALLIKL